MSSPNFRNPMWIPILQDKPYIAAVLGRVEGFGNRSHKTREPQDATISSFTPNIFPQSWASDNHSTLAIGTVQSNIFDFNLVAEGVRHEDEDQSASKHDTSASRLPTPVGISQDSHDTVRLHWQGTQATNKDTPFSDTMDPLWIWSIGPNPCKTAFLQSQD